MGTAPPKFKTDLDLTRLASGKFDTSPPPLMGQSGLLGPGRQRPCGQDSDRGSGVRFMPLALTNVTSPRRSTPNDCTMSINFR